MILQSEDIRIIQKLNYSENDIVKAFGKGKAQEFKNFLKNNSKNFEIETNKLIKFANILNIPFAYIFLNELPKVEKGLADFRAVKIEFSNNLQDCIASSKKKQEWFRNYIIRNGYDKTLNNKNFTSDESIIKEVKKLSDFDKAKNQSKGKRFTYIKDVLEEKNIIVQQSRISQNKTKKSIQLAECRGYAIYDEYCPLIFINSKDTSENGKIFTLLHELAHILLKQSGVSSYDFNQNEEYQCNHIAGEILMPSQDFEAQWKKNRRLDDNIEKISLYFDDIASPLAIATKALLNKLITYAQYQGFKESYLQSIPKERKGGGNYYSNITASNSKNFAKSVIIDTLNGYETYKDAIYLLDIKNIKSFNNLAQNLGINL